MGEQDRLKSLFEVVQQKYSTDCKNRKEWDKSFGKFSARVSKIPNFLERYTDHCIHNISAVINQVDSFFENQNMFFKKLEGKNNEYAKAIIYCFFSISYIKKFQKKEGDFEIRILAGNVIDFFHNDFFHELDKQGFELLNGFFIDLSNLVYKNFPDLNPHLFKNDLKILLKKYEDKKDVEFIKKFLKELNCSFYIACLAFYWTKIIGDKKVFGVCQALLDKMTGKRLYSFPIKNLSYLIASYSNIYSGLSNIKTIEFINEDSLLLTFVHGSFFDQRIDEHVAFNCALVLTEYLRPFVKIYKMLAQLSSIKIKPVNIFVESHPDNFSFAGKVINAASHLDRSIPYKVNLMPALTNLSSTEKKRFLSAAIYTESNQNNVEVINHIKETFKSIDIPFVKQAFQMTRILQLNQDELLFEEDSYPGFVYLPLWGSLYGVSKRSQIKFVIETYKLVGHISVISGKLRQASIYAASKVTLLMIPREIYLLYWFDYQI